MDNQRLRDCLAADFSRLREVASGADLDAKVPSCPDWTMADLLRHVGEVYLHKTECMRLGREPDPWPPAGLAGEPPLDLLDRGYADLTGEFASRRPEEHAFTWYGPDQSVGFWIRRMAQETVIHRVDAELAADRQIAAIPDDLAVDGMDELLVIFVQYGTTNWLPYFPELTALTSDHAVSVVTPQRTWLLRLTPTGALVAEPGPDRVRATVEGPAPAVLLRLWNRGGSGATVTGDEETVAVLQKVLVTSTE
jgi:uncharacterized protein (TIGR03083 family)